MAKNITKISCPLGTHSGVFHADDTFAIATLMLVNPLIEVVRTRDPKILETCALQVDVGAVHDPEAGRFDHHQRGKAGTRPNGVPYSSFGLIWAAYGEELCGDPEVARIVDQALVQHVDLIDNGELLYEGGVKRFEDAQQYSISSAVSSFNPTWEESEIRTFDAGFKEAVSYCRDILRREIASAKAEIMARAVVQVAIQDSEGGPIVMLPRFVPWGEQVRDEAPNALFVVFLSEEGTWMCQAVNKTTGTFESRKLLPESWAGLRGKEFSEAVGIEDGVFCHPGRFICGAGSKDSALRLARSAVAA